MIAARREMNDSNVERGGMPGEEQRPNQWKESVGELIRAGVHVVDPSRTYVEGGVQVAAGVTLFPGTYLLGRTRIEAGCTIGPDCWICDTQVESSCVVRYSVLEQARVREESVVGPYAHLRSGADVGPEARIGNFVEVKKARLDRGVKAGHLAYIGDAQIGQGVNIGAGTITCNYDGVAKHRTVIEEGAFVGSNASLVAPVSIGSDAIVAAGSTVTEDVPALHTAFGRARQVNKPRARAAATEEEDRAHDQPTP
jgi:bifunctional UDP-N-acetylglucosamine pyrophosphorylase / glucosamine-1-phosphate N-acetyltransferase